MFDPRELVKSPVMTLRTTALFVAWSLLATSAFAQEEKTFADSALTAEQWRQRVQDARRRSEEFIATARMRKAIPPLSEKEKAEAAAQRGMNDPSLQQGDIVATSKGFVVFVGRSEDHQSSDFLPVPDAQKPP